LISRQDWWAISVTLLLSGASYFIGGGVVAFIAIFVGTIITIVLHMSQDTGTTELEFKAPAEQSPARERESLSGNSSTRQTSTKKNKDGSVDFIGKVSRTIDMREGQLPSKVPPVSEPEPTLISLMDTGFPHLNKFWGKPVVQFEDGFSLEVKSALYFDMFTSGSKFLGFYIPRTSRVIEVCAALATHAIELGDVLSNGGLSITSKAPGENPQTLNDLSYSGKVYLYHQDSLTHKQMADVEELFKAQKLNVVLRGPDFLAQAWVAWKQKSLNPFV
jgi:hypothetical protein